MTSQLFVASSDAHLYMKSLTAKESFDERIFAFLEAIFAFTRRKLDSRWRMIRFWKCFVRTTLSFTVFWETLMLWSVNYCASFEGSFNGSFYYVSSVSIDECCRKKSWKKFHKSVFFVHCFKFSGWSLGFMQKWGHVTKQSRIFFHFKLVLKVLIQGHWELNLERQLQLSSLLINPQKFLKTSKILITRHSLLHLSTLQLSPKINPFSLLLLPFILSHHNPLCW